MVVYSTGLMQHYYTGSYCSESAVVVPEGISATYMYTPTAVVVYLKGLV